MVASLTFNYCVCGLFMVTMMAHRTVFKFLLCNRILPMTWFVWMCFRIAHDIYGRLQPNIFCLVSFARICFSNCVSCLTLLTSSALKVLLKVIV